MNEVDLSVTLPWWKTPLFFIQDNPISFFSFICVALIVLATFLIAKSVRLSITRLPLFKKYLSVTALYSLERFVHYTILVIGFYLALTTIGIDLTGIAVVIGALSVGIGFGLQTVFNNLIAGIIVLLEKKVRIGDHIQLSSGEVGTVLEINVRSTLIRTLDNRRVLVPNTTIISSQLTNWTLGDSAMYQVQIPFAVKRECDREKVRSLALEVAQEIPFTCLNPKPEVWLTKIDSEIAAFELVVWIDIKKRAKGAKSYIATYLWALAQAFENQSIPLNAMSRPTEMVIAKGL